MEASWLVSAFTWLAFLVIIISNIIYYRRPKQNLPPGPKPWPIIGNLNLLFGSIPHQSLHLLSQKYGELIQLKFGSYPVLVASSPEMAKQFLKTHDTVFASRPALAAGRYTAYNFSDVTWAPYGSYWRQARKIYLTEIFCSKRLDSYEYIRIEERHNFLSRLYALSEVRVNGCGKPIVLREQLSRFSLSSITRMVLGNKYFSESKCDDQGSVIALDELQGLLDQWLLLNGAINIGDWIPWLSFLDLQGYVKQMKDLHKKFDRFHEYVLDDHKAKRDANVKDFVPKDMADVLLQLSEDPNLEVKLTRDCVKGLMQDLLGGGTDTSSTTVEWAFHEIIKTPHIIEKATEELDRVIGRERWVEENDFPKLPYIEAIIKETLRLHPLATLLPPHFAIEDCNASGYDISKGTTILINVWSIGRNPKFWDASEQFLPERFLDKKIDMSGQNFALLPFGSGRRRCPGYNLGLKIIRSTLANLLHGFNWKLPQNIKPKDVCLEEKYGLTTHPKVPLEMIIEPRLQLHLY
ncbi:cytochrome P450 71A1-like [Olea europaea var. sylvestris]|uniref:cytochrome P450 71A1-like n=1 Tax=Olea europaea var. sylvestris TaxID=158386 RepID=UPI000C1D2961|nr:cytochrome P450 71A1-like [Olea europaea var. sylvestris]